MGIATFPSVSSPIKSIQRGSASTAGNITITSIDTTKTVVNSFSTSSTGTVAASGAISGASGSTSGFSINAANSNAYSRLTTASPRYGGSTITTNTNVSFGLNATNANAQNVSLNATNISGGSTNLVSAVYGVYIVNSTTIYATGPCRYEVVEYY